jgi:hypothetical protein
MPATVIAERIGWERSLTVHGGRRGDRPRPVGDGPVRRCSQGLHKPAAFLDPDLCAGHRAIAAVITAAPLIRWRSERLPTTPCPTDGVRAAKTVGETVRFTDSHGRPRWRMFRA